MPAKASLDKIVEGLGMASDDYSTYFDRETGEVYTISHEVFRLIERGGSPDDLPKWQWEDYEIARLTGESGRFVDLPGKWDVHEWQIMADFAGSPESPRLREELNEAIHDSGASRFFRSIVRRRGIEEAWYKYRDEALRQIAREWCEEHGIECEDEPG